VPQERKEGGIKKSMIAKKERDFFQNVFVWRGETRGGGGYEILGGK